jgi:hypothetical protein
MSIKRAVMLLILIFAAVLALPFGSNATCGFSIEGKCETGYTWWPDCDCDSHGCTEPGPPYYICAEATCFNDGFLCILHGDGGYTTGCYPITQPPLECPCPWWMCW